MVARFATSTPRVSLVLMDEASDVFDAGVLPSLAASYQLHVPPDAHEVIVVARPERHADRVELLHRLGVRGTVVSTGPDGSWIDAGASAASGDAVGFLAAPGVASPLLVSSLCAAMDAYPDGVLVVPGFEVGAAVSAAEWLAASEWPRQADLPQLRATFSWTSEAPYRWMDPIAAPENVVFPRRVLDEIRNGGVLDAASLVAARAGRGVQLVGDSLTHPLRDPTRPLPGPHRERRVDPGLAYFGCIRHPGQELVPRPFGFTRNERPRVATVVVSFDMRREAPRTLKSLEAPHQIGLAETDELVLVDNGSPSPLSADEVRSVAPGATYLALSNPPPSPAHALNAGVAATTGELLVLVPDGATLLSPGVVANALAIYRAFPEPVIVTQYFYLGPGKQSETLDRGYGKDVEDALLVSIGWPSDGYRLFEIASPETMPGWEGAWLKGWFESNCIVMPRSLFTRIGGFDERFDLPGGGLFLMDFLTRALAEPGTQPVKLLGEGVFHQVHGGITTNKPRTFVEDEVRRYKEQYDRLRAGVPEPPAKAHYFAGALRNAAARSKMKD